MFPECPTCCPGHLPSRAIHQQMLRNRASIWVTCERARPLRPTLGIFPPRAGGMAIVTFCLSKRNHDLRDSACRVHSHWQPHFLTHPSWKPYDQYGHGLFSTVWKDWWNQRKKGDELISGKVVDFVSLAKGRLSHTRGKFYIREQYVQLYERLCEQAVDPTCGGVVLSGEPGTGKTYCLFFLLLKKLAKGEPVFFSLSRRNLLYFSAGCVHSNSDDIPLGLDELDPDSRQEHDPTWVLIDSDWDDQPPSSALVDQPLFCIQATPYRSLYKAWVKERGGEVSLLRVGREKISRMLSNSSLHYQNNLMPNGNHLSIRRYPSGDGLSGTSPIACTESRLSHNLGALRSALSLLTPERLFSHLRNSTRLMVPRPSEEQGDHTFTWSLPTEFPSSISGPVYIQLVSSQLTPLSAEEDESCFEEDG